jgi:hypothetical protein
MTTLSTEPTNTRGPRVRRAGLACFAIGILATFAMVAVGCSSDGESDDSEGKPQWRK